VWMPSRRLDFGRCCRFMTKPSATPAPADKAEKSPPKARRRQRSPTTAADRASSRTAAEPEVVNVRKAALRERGFDDFIDWVTDPSHIYIGRNMNFYVKGALGSPWQNPFPLKKYSVKQSLAMYEDHVRNGPLFDRLSDLAGARELGCWCHPAPCHGEVLVKLLRERGFVRPQQ
jgi:hypothetical protein